jgi:hypothetical protein
MSTEVVPEVVLRAFMRAYPDLFPTADLSHLGLISDPEFGWPIGFSRSKVKHLGGLSAVGTNCASCHIAEITSVSSNAPIRVLGATSHFDVEAYFGSVLLASFRTAEPANMKRFLAAYVVACDPAGGDQAQKLFEAAWQRQEEKIFAAIKADPFGVIGIEAGSLHQIDGNDLRIDRQWLAGEPDLPALAHSVAKLFHNMRAALHVPDRPPQKLSPSSGPGRNDAFGLLSAGLFNAPQPYAPVKFGLVWDIDKRHWVHWDGNTQSPIARNLLASLGLGAPLRGRQGELDFALVKRQTDLSEKIRPPRYPFRIEQAAAKRGASHFEAKCISCHGGPESDRRLYAVAEVGTDPHRAELFTDRQAERFNKFLAGLEASGYEPSKELGLRSTGKYFAATLAGVWARSPYLHNGSVRTMQELLTAPAGRAKTFHRGSRVYDPAQVGYTDEGAYVFDTTATGNANTGHNYGTALAGNEKRDLIEYLKTL